jgi:beta-lactam-binding protein with PASTA domain
VAIAVVGVVVAGALWPKPDAVKVPDVEGHTVSDALTELRGVGLQSAFTPKYSDEIQGTVFGQSPEGGFWLDAGATVELTWGAQVPLVEDERLRDATTELESFGLGITVTYTYSLEPRGTVLDQNPSADTQVDVGESVALSVAKRGTEVPAVDARKLRDATRELEDVGLIVAVTYRYSHDHEHEGTVLGQTPDAGEVVARGATVRLRVTQAFPEIPDVVGLTLAGARDVLSKEGFNPRMKKEVYSSLPKGTVVVQSPEAWSEARPGRDVWLSVSTGPCTPGYSQCLRPNVGDYDCASGSGDGPNWVYGTIGVWGSDPYGLDGWDNDGRGCE